MIIRPEVLPEEFAPGYKGRFMAMNGITGSKQVMRALVKWSGATPNSQASVSTVGLLAKVADMDTAQFVCAHTLLPLRRAVVAKFQDVKHGSSVQPTLLSYAAMRGSAPGAYMCMRCVAEDIDFHGISYWRREHQIPGQYSCAKHFVPLGCVDAPNAFMLPPSNFYDSHHAIDGKWAKKVDGNGAIQRYLAITSDLLARSMPLDELNVSRTARARASELGLRIGRAVNEKKLVSDLVRQCFDARWLASTLPSLAEKPIGEFWSPIDEAVLGKRRGTSSIIHAAIFAALYESSDAAINAMLALPTEGVSVRRCDVPDVTHQQFHDSYIKHQGRHSEIAQELGLSTWRVRRRLNEQGLPNLGPKSSTAIQDALSAVLIEGISLDHASHRYEIDRADLERLLIRSAAPLRAALKEIQRADQSESVQQRHTSKVLPRLRQPSARAEHADMARTH